MGFKDREQNLKALIESKGDIDGALERLVKDDWCSGLLVPLFKFIRQKRHLDKTYLNDS